MIGHTLIDRLVYYYIDTHLHYLAHEVSGLPMCLQVGHLQQPPYIIRMIGGLVQGEEVGQQTLHDVSNLGGVSGGPVGCGVAGQLLKDDTSDVTQARGVGRILELQRTEREKNQKSLGVKVQQFLTSV